MDWNNLSNDIRNCESMLRIKSTFSQVYELFYQISIFFIPFLVIVVSFLLMQML